jgi:hypothetical protein
MCRGVLLVAALLGRAAPALGAQAVPVGPEFRISRPAGSYYHWLFRVSCGSGDRLAGPRRQEGHVSSMVRTVV